MFDKVILKKNGWHVKLQIWTFGDVPYKNNFCPFFWLSVFCLIASPFVGVYKLCRYGVPKAAIAIVMAATYIVGKPLELLSNLFDKYLCQPIYEQQTTVYAEKMDDEDAYNLYEIIFEWNYNTHLKTVHHSNNDKNYWFMQTSDKGKWFCNLKSKKQNKLWDRWRHWEKNAGNDWKERLAEMRAKHVEAKQKRLEANREKLEASEAKKLLKEKRRKSMMLALVKYTKYIVFLVVGIPCIYIIYWLGLLGIVIYENWSSIIGYIGAFFYAIWYFIVYIAPMIGVVLLTTLVIVLAVISAVKIIQKCSIPAISIPGIKYIAIPFARIGKVIFSVMLKIGSVFKSVIEFFVLYFKTFKENNCPPIEWGD